MYFSACSKISHNNRADFYDEAYNNYITDGWDDAGDRYIHVTAKELGTAKLYAKDRKEHGKCDACTVNVVTPYELMLQELCEFSNDEIKLVLKLYNKVNSIFTTENTLQKAWRCARLLSEFCYDIIAVTTFLASFKYIRIINILKHNKKC